MTWTNRYQHDMTLSIRVWPYTKSTHRASLQKSEWKVEGLKVNGHEHLEAVVRHGCMDAYTWEMSDADAERLASAGAAGAKFHKVTVRTPGTTVNNVKMECWLEVEMTLNPKAWRRKEYGKGDPVLRGTEAEIADQVKAIWENDVTRVKKWAHERYGFTKDQLEERYADYPRREFTGVHYVLNPEMADLNLLASEVMKGKAILVDRSLRNRFDVDKIDRALDYWTIPGAAPDAPGGEFNPLQLGRSVFWCRDTSMPEWMRGDGEEAVRKFHKEEHLEKMRSKTQRYFIEHVTERVAKRYGISRERVASRLIEEGFMDWMVEESRKIWDDPERAKFLAVSSKCKAAVDESAKILSFAIDCLAVRPPDPIPPMLTPKQQEARLEYRRKKLDAFNKLTKEEQEKVLAKKAQRERNQPQNVLKRIVAAYAFGEGRPADEVQAELQAAGVHDLIVNGLKTRREVNSLANFCDEQSAMYERIGPKVIRLFLMCRSGEAATARDEVMMVAR